MEGQDAPIVLVQDYHLALLPALIKAQRPDARVAIFWHIPWPNFESFGICPWRGRSCSGCWAPTSSASTPSTTATTSWTPWTARWRPGSTASASPSCGASRDLRQALSHQRGPGLRGPAAATSGATNSCAELGLNVELLGVGVERIDYTKGLPERFRALQRFFERHPEYRERLASCRSPRPAAAASSATRSCQAEVDQTVEEVNRELGTRHWKPIVYLKRHFDHRDIWPFYRHADFCMVTSLHDGMNLVAKESFGRRRTSAACWSSAASPGRPAS